MGKSQTKAVTDFVLADYVSVSFALYRKCVLAVCIPLNPNANGEKRVNDVSTIVRFCVTSRSAFLAHVQVKCKPNEIIVTMSHTRNTLTSASRTSIQSFIHFQSTIHPFSPAEHSDMRLRNERLIYLMRRLSCE